MIKCGTDILVCVGFQRCFVAIVISVAGITGGIAQHRHPAPSPEKPVALLAGLGTWTHPIATRNPAAQKFFDQGLTLIYGFNRPEALRSFRKASELDPSAAMAYWGIAMALGPYINMDMDPDVHLKEACDAVEVGLRVSDLREVERAWLNAAQARCPDYADPARYVRATHELANRYPDDPDAQTLYAEALLLPVRWHWYSIEGKPAEGVAEAERVLQGVLHRHPDHPGANHFYIHAVESSPSPERAVPSAQRLMGIVPAAGHIVHMPGHIWLVLGDYNNTVAVNERAVEVDRQYFTQTGMMGSYFAYYLHNQQFILYARAMQGRLADTRKAAREISESLADMAKTMPEMAEVFGVFVTLSQLRMCRWDELIAAGRPKSENPLTLAMWHYGRALAYAGKRQLDEARREQPEFEKLRKALDRNMPWDTNKLGDVMDLASAALAARLESTPAMAVPKWKHAVTLQDALAYDEPPAWYYPIRESLGAAILLSGDAAGAERVFREGLRRSPNNGRMLFGLLESLKAQHKNDAIAWVQREFEAAWKGADVELRIADL
jgi:tetratricopeptide (TPR) repeat protein